MQRKILILFLFFYLLVLFQTSFLAHFSFKGYFVNFVLIAIIFLNFFEKPENYLAFWAAFFGGFFSDIFSSNFIGFWLLIFILLTFFIKIILRRYLRFPILLPWRK